MSERHDTAAQTIGPAHERAAEVLTELVTGAGADQVYSEPVVVGDRTVITAAEIHTGLGFGYGIASGSRTASRGWRRRDPGGEPRDGGGGGGGGHASGRPVAIITIDPSGVHVKPVLDRTRIVLTGLTALGAIGWTLMKMRRPVRRVMRV